ncbi:YciI family protein [Streptomyces xanthochromogenes]|uniref:YciI family protein n=1 Tax=Streptomyces xanthochromogenes TaxID=67384 RepID=UPI0034244D7C
MGRITRRSFVAGTAGALSGLVTVGGATAAGRDGTLERAVRDLAGRRPRREFRGVFAGGLAAPSTATVLREKNGDVLTTDGPYIESKEYLGGLCIVKAPDLDAALEWGRKAVLATTLPIEVRPFYGEIQE